MRNLILLAVISLLLTGCSAVVINRDYTSLANTKFISNEIKTDMKYIEGDKEYDMYREYAICSAIDSSNKGKKNYLIIAPKNKTSHEKFFHGNTDIINYSLSCPLLPAEARKLIKFLSKISMEWYDEFEWEDIQFRKLVISPKGSKYPRIVVTYNHNKTGTRGRINYQNSEINSSTIILKSKEHTDDMIELLGLGLNELSK